MKALCQDLEHQVDINTNRILLCEQYSRNANLEIKGVPVEGNENLTTILGKLGEATGETISPDEIEICHRVPVAKHPSDKNIIVQFVHRANRNSA